RRARKGPPPTHSPRCCRPRTRLVVVVIVIIIVIVIVVLVPSDYVDEAEHPVVHEMSAVLADDQEAAGLREPVLDAVPNGGGGRPDQEGARRHRRRRNRARAGQEPTGRIVDAGLMGTGIRVDDEAVPPIFDPVTQVLCSYRVLRI